MKAWSVVIPLLLAAAPLRAETIELTTGEVLHAVVIERTETVLVIEHTVLGRLEIPAASVKSIGIGPPGPLIAQAGPVMEIPHPEGGPLPPRVTVEEAVAAASTPGSTEKSRWINRLELGVNAREGHTQDANIRTALTSTLAAEDLLTTLDARYALTTSRGDRTENKLTSGLRLEWPTPESNLDYFADARYDYDEFNSWKHRVTAGGGCSVQLIDRKREDEDGAVIDILGVKVRIGGGLNREFGSQRDDVQPEGILGGDLSWRLTDRQHLAGTFTLFPSLEEFGQYRVVNSLEWVCKLDFMTGLSLKLGLADEYQSQVDPGVENNNLTVFASLLLDF